MHKKTTHGGAAMIGGVRSPMASSGHGLVGGSAKQMKPHGLNITQHSKGAKTPPIKSPQKASDNVCD
jgi:hypothetical protein